MRADVIVVGAGIVGLSTAFALRRRGMAVAVVKQGPVPNPLASSCDHHRLIRMSYGPKRGYGARMPEAFAAWREMWGELGREIRYYEATGILNASQEAGDDTDLSTRAMDALGQPYERIEGHRLAERFPFLEAANLAYATLSEGGALMANAILGDLVGWLRGAGVPVLEQSPVKRVEAGAVRLADGVVLEAGRVVVAAGVGTGRLVPEFGVPLVPRRSLVVWAEPPKDLRAAWEGAPCWNDLGGPTELWGMPPMRGLPGKFGNGAMGRSDGTDAERTTTREELRASLAGYRGRIRGIDRFAIRWGQANYWTHAPGEAFVLRDVDGVLAVSACSGHGFKFGALSGRDVADAVTGAPVEDVAARMAAAA